MIQKKMKNQRKNAMDTKSMYNLHNVHMCEVNLKKYYPAAAEKRVVPASDSQYPILDNLTLFTYRIATYLHFHHNIIFIPDPPILFK